MGMPGILLYVIDRKKQLIKKDSKSILAHGLVLKDWKMFDDSTVFIWTCVDSTFQI